MHMAGRADIGLPAHREVFMGIELLPDSLEGVSGLVEYGAAFSIL